MQVQPPVDQRESSSVVPDDFAALVRDAYSHLYDYAHLERHPLTRLVAPLRSTQSVAKDLRGLLLDTLEEIHPGGHISRNDSAWRPYGILVQRYVDGFDVDHILADLHISLRQFQRDHRKGILAVGSVLWRRWQASDREGDSGDSSGRGAALSDEVARLGLKLERVDLTAIVHAALVLADVLARDRIVRLDTEPPREPVGVWADATLAKQAVVGALNALIAARPVQAVVAWRDGAKHALVEVIATPALPGDDASASQVVEKFGSSLELMETQGGRLETVWHGGCLRGVRLWFPRSALPMALVIDDNDRLLQLFERYLTSEGLLFRGVATAQAALEAIAQETPQVVVLDVMMRDVDSWQLLQTLRARPELSPVPIIVCSVLDQQELAFALGAQGYLKKPVSRQEVLSAVRAALTANSPEAPHITLH